MKDIWEQDNIAFLYRWTDHKYGIYYVGYHKGTPYDGYICSSEIMLRKYNKRPED